MAARQKALTAGDATASGTLVPTQFSTDFIELLRSVAVMRKLGVTTLPLPVGNITLPKATGGATAGYIGETSSDNIAKSQLSTGDISLKFKKLAVLTPISNSLLRYSSPGADAIVRNDLLAAMAVKEDGAFIRGQGYLRSAEDIEGIAVATGAAAGAAAGAGAGAEPAAR